MKLAFKFFFWTVGSIIFLLLLLFILIQVPAVQDFALKKTVSFLQNKINTRVEIKKLSIDLPKLIVLEGVYIEDQKRDTLLYGEVLKVDISLIRLFSNQVQINKIDLQGITAKIQRTLPDSVFNFDYILRAFITTPDKNIPPDTISGMNFSVHKINLDQINISFKDAITTNDIRFEFDHFETSFGEFDLDKMKFSIPGIKLSGLNATIVQSIPALKQDSTANVEAKNNTPSEPDLKLGTVDLSKIRINYQNEVSHLKTNLILGHLLIDVESINLKKQSIALKNIKLTNINSEVVLGKPELAKDVKKTPEETLNSAWRITVGKVDFGDINLKFDDFNKPALQQGMDYSHLDLTGFNLQAESFIYSRDTISGRITDASLKNKDIFLITALQTNFVYSKTDAISRLIIPDLRITAFENTRINTTGYITGLPDMNGAKFDVIIRELKSGSADMYHLLPSGLIPETIRLPKDFSISGKFNGGFSSFETNLDMNSSYGTALISASLQNGNQKGNETFKTTIDLVGFNAGQLLKQDTILGRISGHAQVTGTGNYPKTMIAKFSLVDVSAEVRRYTYRNLALEGNIANKNLALIVKMDDQNLHFSLDAKVNIGNKYPAVDFTLNIDTLNLQKLNLYDSDLRFHGKIMANLPSTNPDSLIGTLTASNLLLSANEKLYHPDSLYLSAEVTEGQKKLSIESEVLTASLNGHYNISELRNVIINEINKYFKIGDGKEMPVSSAHNFTFELNIKNHPIVQEIVPLLTQLEPILVKGSFNSEGDGLKMEAAISKIIYSGTTIDNIILGINNDGNALNYNLNLDKIATSSLMINKTSLNGQAQDNRISVNLNVKDQSIKDQYILAGLFSVIDGQYQFSFNKDSLTLNYDPWNVAPENFVQFGPKGIMAGNLHLSGNGQSLLINSNPQQINAPLVVDFTNFKISTLTAFAKPDTLLLDGIINGNVELTNLEKSPAFVGDLTVKNFTFRADTLGDISLKVNNQIANTYAASINITGKGNDIVLEGEYFLRPENKSIFDFDLDIRKMNLATIEGFTLGNLKNASGNISGKLNITGSVQVPAIRGDLNFNKVAFNIARINSFYTIDNEDVNFTAEGIRFNTFTLVDPAGNTAILDGSVYTTNFQDYRFGLDVTTSDFKVLSSTKKDNKIFWGNVFLNSNVRISGDLKSPVVEGGVKINKGTDFSLVLPQSAPGVVEREGIVEFADMNIPQSETDFTTVLDSLNTSTLTGMDISVNVEVDSNAVFNIIIDEGSGDFLEVQGEALLAAGIDRSGKVNLTGNFEVTKGAYELSFNFLKRRFLIEKGSVITWQGEPTKATVNVTAVYVANTAPYDLVASQLNEPPSSLNHYKQKLPFEVTLNMKGELMRPQITFDINLPNRNYYVTRDVIDNVQYQLIRLKSQSSELNKQVFAVLLLNRFVAENPFAAGICSGHIVKMNIRV